jgi:hypothetical protein
LDELGNMKLDLPASRGTDRHDRKLSALGAAERRPSSRQAVHRVVRAASPSDLKAGSRPTTAELVLEELERIGLEDPQPASASQPRGHGTSRFFNVYPIQQASSQCDTQSARSLFQRSESTTSTAITARQGESTARPPPQPGLSTSQQLLLEEAVLQEEGSPAGPSESARRGRASVGGLLDAEYQKPNRENSIDALLQDLANMDEEHGEFAEQAQLWTADARQQQPGSRSLQTTHRCTPLDASSHRQESSCCAVM